MRVGGATIMSKGREHRVGRTGSAADHIPIGIARRCHQRTVTVVTDQAGLNIEYGSGIAGDEKIRPRGRRVVSNDGVVDQN